MPYLIDGNNLLGCMDPGGLKDPEGKRRLLGRLVIFQRAKRAGIQLVFDGPPDPGIEGTHGSRGALRVTFPFPGEKADRVIEDIIEHVTDKRRYFVVTSDRELRDFARSRGLKVLKSPEFLKEMKKVLREERRSREDRKEDVTLTRLEVDQWMDVFGDDDE